MTQLEYTSTTGLRRPLKVAYVDLGPKSNAPDLFIMVHGLATNADTFARVIDAYAEHGRVLAIDLPGSGDSDAPEDFDYSFVHQADVLAQFIRAAPALTGLPATQRPVLVGLSLGGGFVAYVTLEKMADPRALVLAGPGGYPMKLPFLFHLLKGPMAHAVLYGASLLDPHMYSSRFYYKDEVKTPDLAAMMGAQFRDRPRRHALAKTFANGVDMELSKDVAARMHEIKTPALIVWGEKDEMIPPDHRFLWGRDLENSTVVLIPGCGHSVPEEASAEYLAAVGEFLGWK